MSRRPALQGLIDQGKIWPATRRDVSTVDPGLCPTGHRELDDLLGGGLPRRGLIEFLSDGPGLGESRLLKPLWQAVASRGHWHVCVCPPCLPYAPNLQASGLDPDRWLLVHTRSDAECLWAMEQSLRSGACASLMAWPGKIDMTALRRLQLLAQEHRVPVVLLRADQQRQQASPALLRLCLKPQAEHVQAWQANGLPAQQGHTVVEVLKCRGGRPHSSVTLDLFDRSGAHGWLEQTAVRSGLPGRSPALPWSLASATSRVAAALRH